MRRILTPILIALLSAFAGTTQAQIVDTVCASGGPSNLAVNPTTGSSYQWWVNGGSILSGQGTNGILVDWISTPGLYDATVVETNADGCIGDTIKAQVYITLPNTSYISGPTIACEGQYVELKASDDKNTGKFLWTNGDSADVISFFASKDTTIYRVAFNENCENDTVFHTVRVLPTPQIAVSTDAHSDTISFNTYVNFMHNGEQIGNIEWYLNGLWMGSGTSVDMLFTQPGWNTIQAVGRSGLCSDTLTHHMYVEEELKVHIPTAFSPNGDGLNDVWNFEGFGFDDYEVHIFDRWGNEMAAWDKEHPGEWDGTFRGQKVAPGAYSYSVKVITVHNHIKNYNGVITVIR